MRRADRRFAPSWFASLLVLGAVVLFSRLGFWQLDRAAQKRDLEAQHARGQQLVLSLTPANADRIARYQRVRASGHYDPGHQVLLDNMPSAAGLPGYRVVTPFELEQGGWILVDRGWQPLGRTRADLPDIAVGDRPRAVTGEFDRLPEPGVRLGESTGSSSASWPRVMSFPRHVDLERALGRRVHEGLLLLDPDEADGYERLWPAHSGFGPQRHIGYAVQWFAFAVAAVVIYIVMGMRGARTSQP